jgi:eukaryotic-like serine/threonine-protein kinase
VSSSPAVSNSAGPQTPTASPPPGPVIIVQEYFAAIDSGDYAKAWRLGGSNFSPSYAAYVAGFQGTVNDVITIISVEGRVVTARLAALQADGSTKKYEGEYTVIHGVIAKSSVQQLP